MAIRGSRGGSANAKKTPVPTPPHPQAMPVTSAGGAVPQSTTTQRKRRTRGGKSAAASSTPLEPAPSATEPQPPKKSGANIIWEGSRTDQLVAWITSHAADRHILFHDRSTSTPTPAFPSGDKPSGKNKKDVAAVIARQIFEADPDHATSYASDATRYVTSVTNRLGALKAKYREQRLRFRSTGAGVIPHSDDDSGPPAQNLLEDVLRVFPYYEELDAIWKGIPSFDSELVSSKPKANHAESLLNIVAPKASGISATPRPEPGGEDVDIPDVQGEEDEEEQVRAPQTIDEEDIAMNDDTFFGDLNGDDDDVMGDSEQPYEEPQVPVPKQKKAAVEHRALAPSSGRGSTSLSAASKGKTPVRESRAAFTTTRHSPYSRTPSSVGSGSMASKKSTWSDSLTGMSATKQTTPSGSRNLLASKIEELDRASEALEAAPAAASRTALRLNYSLRKQELEIQKDELNAKWANADAEFQREHDLKMLDIKLKESEERSISRSIDLLNKQMEYARTMQQLSLGGGPPMAAIPLSMPFLPAAQRTASSVAHHGPSAAGPSSDPASHPQAS